MGSLFSPPKPPALPAPAPLPTLADPAVDRRRRDEAAALKRRGGRQSLIKAGGLGDIGSPEISRPKLLGQVGGGS